MTDLLERTLVASMHAHLDEVQPDLATLAAVATRQGTRLRRRRKAGAGLAVAACVGLGTVAYAALPGGPGSSGAPLPPPVQASATDPTPTETTSAGPDFATCERQEGSTAWSDCHVDRLPELLDDLPYVLTPPSGWTCAEPASRIRCASGELAVDVTLVPVLPEMVNPDGSITVDMLDDLERAIVSTSPDRQFVVVVGQGNPASGDAVDLAWKVDWRTAG